MHFQLIKLPATARQAQVRGRDCVYGVGGVAARTRRAY
jgi:hypothetical protein